MRQTHTKHKMPEDQRSVIVEGRKNKRQGLLLYVFVNAVVQKKVRKVKRDSNNSVHYVQSSLFPSYSWRICTLEIYPEISCALLWSTN